MTWGWVKPPKRWLISSWKTSRAFDRATCTHRCAHVADAITGKKKPKNSPQSCRFVIAWANRHDDFDKIKQYDIVPTTHPLVVRDVKRF